MQHQAKKYSFLTNEIQIHYEQPSPANTVWNKEKLTHKTVHFSLQKTWKYNVIISINNIFVIIML